jgi:predicted DNA-binding transcriptional regulator AlpA
MAVMVTYDNLHVLRYRDFVERNIVGNRTTLRRWMTRDDDPFPQPIRLGPNTIAWSRALVEAWLQRRAGKGAV